MIHILQPPGMEDDEFIKAITLEVDVDGIKDQLSLALPGHDKLVYRIVEKEGRKIIESKTRKNRI